MAVVKEFWCADHGDFDRSHPICPTFGCDSKHVTRVFRTAPGIVSSRTRRTDAGIRKSADMYHINNFRSAQAGEPSFGGEAAKAAGTELLWGDQAVRKAFGGKSIGDLSGMAAQPLNVKNRDTGEALPSPRNIGIVDAAEEAGVTRRRLPKAGEVTSADKAERA